MGVFNGSISVHPWFKEPPRFLKGVVDLEGLPPLGMPELAFAGRSNVGKSSLINALFSNKTVARVSNTPGRTQELNFFALSDHCFLVDLPGYGYAQAPKDKVDRWNDLIRLYLKGRATLRRIYVLIDSRHGLMKRDVEVLKELDAAAVSYQIVLTKSDKLKPAQVQACWEKVVATLKAHPAAHPEVLITSSVTQEGILPLQQAMAQTLLDIALQDRILPSNQ